MKRYYFAARCAAIIFMAAGYGWAAGHYIQATSSVFIYLFQFIIIVSFLAMSIRFFTIPEKDRQKNNWAVTGLTVFSIIALLVNILDIVTGASRSGINFLGSRDSFADLVPVVLLMLGNCLWMITIRHPAKPENKSKFQIQNQYNIL
jgi:hypothetical protein